MANNLLDLEINIGAKTEDLAAELQRAENYLRKLQSALKKATDVDYIQKLTAKIGTVTTSIGELNTKLNTVGRPTADATNALSNLSRVAQDAPFGFIAISNNINPLLESFQRLQKDTGSTKAALLSMASGLTGPAGIGVAIGAISALSVVFSKQLTEAFKGPKDAVKEFREELGKVKSDVYKLIGGIEATRTTGLGLVKIITGGDENEQKRALERLKELFKDNAAIQDLKLGQDKAYYTRLINIAAIQKEAIDKQKNNEDALALLYGKEEQLENERDNLLKKVKDRKVTQAAGGYGGTVTTIETAEFQRSKITALYNVQLEPIRKSIAEAEALNDEFVKTITTFKTPDKKGGTKDTKKDPFTELTKDFNNSLNAQETLRSKSIIDQQTYLDNTYKIYQDYINKLAELNTKPATDKIESLLPKFDKMTFDKNVKEIKEGIKIAIASYDEPAMEAPKDTYIEDSKKKYDEYLKWLTDRTKWKEKLAQKNIDKEKKDLDELTKKYEKFAMTVASDITGAFSGMYQAMQQGVSAGDALAQAFGRLAMQIAETLIQATIFAGIFSLLSGGAGAAGGLSFFGAFTKILGLASGGVATGPTLAMIGEGAESEAVLPLSKLNGMLNTSFNAGSMSNNSMSQNGQFVLRGNDLVLALQRSNSSLNLRRGI